MAPIFVLLVLCWGFRLSCSVTVSAEWIHNISTHLFSLSGDIMLGGLFPINHLSSNLSQRREPNDIRCESLNENGLGLAIVMKYAVDEINGNQTLLPGIKLGYQIYDTCSQSAIIMKPTISFLTAKSNKLLAVDCNYTNYETSVSAVIGPYSSEMVSVIGKLLGFFQMPQISFGATSEKFSDNIHYPSFFRTVPSDKWEVRAIACLLREFQWNWVAVVGSEEEYGKQGVQSFLKIAENMSICVAYQGLIPVYTDPKPAIKTIVYNIQATKVGVTIVFSLPKETEVFFKEVIRRNVTGVWVTSSSWFLHKKLTSFPNIQTVGTIIGFTDKTETVEMLPTYTEKLFLKLSEERVKTSHPAPTSGNPCPQCWNLSLANISLVTEPAVKHRAFSVYAAIYSVAHALHNLLRCTSAACMWGSETKIYPWKLLEALRNTSVNITGKHLVFDNNGNPNIGYTLVEWIWKDSGVELIDVGSYEGANEKLCINKSLFKWHTANSEVPQSTCSAECEKGQVRRVKGFHSCCFDCISCLPGTYQANEDDIQCTKCPKGQWSLNRSTNCTKPTFDVLSWDTPEALKIVLAVMLLLLCQGTVGFVFLKNRGTPLVMASGGALSFMALLSLMGVSLSLLLFLGQPGDLVCRLLVPLTSFFQTVALSIMTSISLQIFYMTEFPERAASHLHILRGRGSWLFVLASCAVQVGLCGWFVGKVPSLSEYIAKMKIDFVRTFLSCPLLPLIGFALTQGFNCVMALISFMCTFMAMKPLHQYNLARDITFACLIYNVIWVTFIPIYMGLSYKDKTIAHVYFTLASNLALVAAYYFPKCYLLLRTPVLNTPQHFCSFLEGVPPTNTREKPQPQSQPGKATN